MSLCLTMHYYMKTYGASGHVRPSIFTLDSGLWSVISFTPLLLNSVERTPSIHWIGKLSDSTASLENQIRSSIS